MNLGGRFCGSVEKYRRQKTANGLPEIFLAYAQALRILSHQLAVIIHPANGTEEQRGEQHHPHKAIVQIRPQQGGDKHGDENERAAHGRCAGLGKMRLRTIAAHHLPYVVLGELADQRRTDQETDGKRREYAENGAQRQISKNVERRDIARQPVEESVEHLGLSSVGIVLDDTRHHTLHLHEA